MSPTPSADPVDLRRWRDLGALLLGDTPMIDRLTTYLTTARRMLDGVSLATLFEAAFPRREDIDYLCSVAVPSLHIGFLTPPGPTKLALPKAATAAGFSMNHRSFPSTIMSRELGALLGERRVSTTIFKAYAARRSGMLLSFEAFIPDADEAIVTDWIERGVGCHLGVALRSIDAVLRAIEICRGAGFELPRFMGDRPVTNSAEDVTAFYADGDSVVGPLRLEFFYDTIDINL